MNKLKNILIVILTAGLLATSFMSWYFHHQKTKTELSEPGNIITADQAAKIIDRIVDSAGRNHVVIAASENQLATNWYKNGTAIKGGLIDTVAKALNIAKKQLVDVTQIATITKARALKAERMVDSLKRVTYYYRGKYLQLAYRPPDTDVDSTDHGQFDYLYNDSLNIVQYWKKKWLLGAKKNYIDIFSNDQNTTVNGVKRLVVQQKKSAFGFHIQAVGNYSFSNKTLNFGPGIQLDIKNFSLTGNYNYDFDTKSFEPTIGARFDLAIL